MKSEVLQKLINKHMSFGSVANLGEYIAHVLDEEQKVKRRVATIQRARTAAQAEYHAQISRLDQELAEVQSECSHGDVTYHSDPAGGSDSYSACEICGRQW